MVALCNATDSNLIAGHFPGVDTYPLALGHENAGIVVAVGEEVRNFKVGDRAIGGLISDFGAQGINSGWGGFSEYVVVNDFEVLKEEGLATPEQGCWDSFEIQNSVPAHVQPEEAVISCTWREVLGAFKDFNLTPGKKVIVVGSGPVGLSFVKLGKLFGLGQIDIVDMLPAKLEVARRMGADNGYTPAEISTPEFIAAAGRSYDAVIDAVGLDVVVNSVLPLVKMGGDVCVYGVMTKNPTFDLSKAPYNFDLHMHQWPTRSEEKAAMTTLAQWIDERPNYINVVNTLGQMAGILGKRSENIIEDTYYTYDYSFLQDGRLKDITLIDTNKTGYSFLLRYADSDNIE